MSKVRTMGDELDVFIPENEVWQWSQRWPCSTLRGGDVWCRFASNGDLVDHDLGDVDGHELSAICTDAIASVLPDHPAIRGEPDPAGMRVVYAD